MFRYLVPVAGTCETEWYRGWIRYLPVTRSVRRVPVTSDTVYEVGLAASRMFTD